MLPRNQTTSGAFFKCKGNFKNKLIQKKEKPILVDQKLKRVWCSEFHPLIEDNSSFIGQITYIIAAYVKDKRETRAWLRPSDAAGIKGEMGSGFEVSDPNLGHSAGSAFLLYYAVLGGRVDT